MQEARQWTQMIASLDLTQLLDAYSCTAKYINVFMYQAARAEMRNAKLIRVMSGAESVLERQTSRGLSRVGAIFTAANRLISKDMAQHMGLSAAHKLGSCQLELKQLANEVLDALWQLRGLTKQVPPFSSCPQKWPEISHPAMC